MDQFPNQAEREAVPRFVANTCQCRICGANADRHDTIYICQKNQFHMGDTFVGIFFDSTPPETFVGIFSDLTPPENNP